MDSHNHDLDGLRAQVNSLELQLANAKKQLDVAESQLKHEVHRDPASIHVRIRTPPPTLEALGNWTWPLEAQEYIRYGRQMIMPEVALRGQLNLKSASVLIVGLGGLGCPAAAYLAGAGVGTIGLVDGDIIELSNLHRQILHSTTKLGMSKVDSAIDYLRQLNPQVNYNAHPTHFSPSTALETLKPYDIVLDCTDHPTSRYLISDAAVLASKPLVSASALKTEGQLMVLNNPPGRQAGADGGPCYRCIFPKPPLAESVLSCGEGGILGPVVGVMGILMAVEAIKMIVAGLDPSLQDNIQNNNAPTKGPPSLLLYSAFTNPQFRSIRLRGRRPQCVACSEKATITWRSLTSGSLDYNKFCGIANPINILTDNERITAREYQSILQNNSKRHLLLDVRDKVQFNICHLGGSINIPILDLESNSSDTPFLDEELLTTPIYVVCRLGNDSQRAVQKLKSRGCDHDGQRYIADITGGFRAWKQEVDSNWPEY